MAKTVDPKSIRVTWKGKVIEPLTGDVTWRGPEEERVSYYTDVRVRVEGAGKHMLANLTDAWLRHCIGLPSKTAEDGATWAVRHVPLDPYVMHGLRLLARADDTVTLTLITHGEDDPAGHWNEHPIEPARGV